MSISKMHLGNERQCPLDSSWTLAGREAFACVRLGLVASFQLRPALYALGVWLFAVVIAALAVQGLLEPISAALLPRSDSATLYGWLRSVLRALLGVLLFVAMLLLVVRVVLDFFLIDVIVRDAERNYPPMHPTVTILPPWHPVRMGNALRPLLLLPLAIPLLWLPLLGWVLVFFLLAYISTCTLLSDALLRLRPASEVRALIRRDRRVLLLLSAALLVVNIIPLNFLSPWIMGSTLAHYGQRLRQYSL